MDPEGTVGRIAQFRPHSQCARTWIPVEYTHASPHGNGNCPSGGIKTSQTCLRKVSVPFLYSSLMWVPLFAGWLLSEIVDFVTFDLLGIVSHFPLPSPVYCPFLFSGIHAYLNDGYTDAWQVRSVLLQAKKFWPKLAIPVIAFWEYFSRHPIYGLSFSWSLGTSCLLHSLAILRLIDYFERFENNFCSTYAYLRLSMPSLWTHLGLFQSMNDDPVKSCPKCKKRKAKRLLGVGAGLIFKGTGFYEPITKKVEARKRKARAIPDPPIHQIFRFGGSSEKSSSSSSVLLPPRKRIQKTSALKKPRSKLSFIFLCSWPSPSSFF